MTKDRSHSFIVPLLALACLLSPVSCRDVSGQPSGARSVTPRGDLTVEEKAHIEIFQKSMRSVLFVTTVQFAQDYFGFNVFEIPRGAGSGFVWDADGHIVTNFHVVADLAGGGGAAEVRLADQSTWKARLVGAAPDKDLAVLKIDAPRNRLQPIPIGVSKDLQVGQVVYAIGNPFGLDQTMTTGIVSAIGREIKALTGRTIHGVIQTDAAINPGNSGGPLLDSAGRLIGVNTAIYSPSGASAGVGFAVPVDIVHRTVPQLIRHGREIRPSLGIAVASDQIARNLGLAGVIVIETTPGGPAAEAGVRPLRRNRTGDIALGDVIVGLDNRTVSTMDELLTALEARHIGDRVQLHLLRDGRRRTVTATLGASR